MIAAWMLESVLIASILMFAAHIAVRSVRAFGSGERFVWLAAMALALVISVTRFPLSTSEGESDLAKVSAPLSISADLAAATTGMTAGSNPVASKLRLPTLGLRTFAVPAILTTFDKPLLFLWAAAALAWAWLLLSSGTRLRRERVTWQPLMMDETPVYVSHDVGPALFGIVRHSIVLPSWVVQLEPSRRRLILAHERQHARAADPMMLFAGAVGVMLQPWNAVTWLLFRRLRLAIETDCDARVLEASPDVRAYADLLLEIGERTLGGATPMTALAEPNSILAKRIDLMTRHPVSRPLLRSLFSVFVGAVLVLAACQLPRPTLEAHAYRTVRDRRTNDAATTSAFPAPQHARVIVRVSSVGLEETEPSSLIVVYTAGHALVGLGIHPPSELRDTLRLRHLGAMTLDVTDGDVHLELVGPGRLSIGGDVSGGPAAHVSATGRHVVVLKGGVGIDPGFAAQKHSGASARTSVAQECASLVTGTTEIPFDTLKVLARRLYPEVFAPGVGDTSVTVGLLFNANCQLTKHAVGRRPSDHLSVVDAFNSLMPSIHLQHEQTRSSGFLALRDRQPGSPMLVWAVLEDSVRR